MKKSLPLIFLCSVSLTACSPFQTTEIQQEEATPTKYAATSSNVLYLHEQVGTRSGNDAYSSITRNGNVVVDFYADWCPPCRQLSPVINQVAKQFPQITFLKVDVDQFRNIFDPIRNSYKAKGIPTLVFYQNGKVVHHLSGFRPKAAFENILKTVY